MRYLGETAGILTAACWATTSLLFGFAVQRLGSFRLNTIRLTLATVMLALLTWSLYGTRWLSLAHPRDLAFLAISGWIGLTLGDWAYFRALDLLGPRLGTIFVTLAPPITAILGAFFLNEHLAALGILGMALTLSGVIWVSLERSAEQVPRGHRIRGALCGVLGSIGQAVGYVLTKAGMAHGVEPLPASWLRLAAATLAVWIMAGALRRPLHGTLLLRDRRVLAATLAATILGPVVGVWLSLVAVQHTQTGIAATLVSSVPVLVLPLVAVVHKERVSPRAMLGAAVAVAGVALLFIHS